MTVRNGTLRASSAALGEGYALRAAGGGPLRVEGVRVVGTGVQCEGGGHVVLTDAHVADAPKSGVRSTGTGSHATIVRDA